MSGGAGKVYLVGAGPGDPGLLTLRGREVLERADAVVYDALVNPAILAHARHAELVYVGKQPGGHSLPQEEIHRILLEQAQRHQIVVRLKGGDPFVFGRGGEEAQALRAAGVAFEVVPGVTAGIAAAAYAGIPVTHRGVATSVTFLTGQTGPTGAGALPDLARVGLEGTLCCYMAVKTLPALVEQLQALGRPGESPVAVVEWGTYARQRTVTATLETVVDLAEREKVGSPALVVIGAVAGDAVRVPWFETRPLHGLRVAVTHTAQRQGALEARLQELGATIFSFPTIEIAAPPREVLNTALQFHDWIILSSANAAELLFQIMDHQTLDARSLGGTRICAVGAATVQALQWRFLRADLQPESYEPEAVLAAMGAVAGARVLLPRADIGRSGLPKLLRAQGAVVTELAGYEKRLPQTSEEQVAALLRFVPGLVVFTNASAVVNFARILGRDRLETLREAASFASIGPVTTAEAAAHGLAVAVEPAQHRVEQLVEAVVAWHVQMNGMA
jgi:uroporphyrinogen III methyltransferase/synthase